MKVVTSALAAALTLSSTCTNAFAFTATAHTRSKPTGNFGVNTSVSSSTSLYGRGGGNRGRRQPRVIEVKPPMNMELPNIQIRVVTPNPKGKDDPLGVMGRGEALQLAKEMGNLDLVMINPSSDPPVCKIVEYSKYRYEKEKKAKELKKGSKATEIKEVKMSYKIDVHDYNVRMKNASKFINQGNRVKCTIMFKGREIQHDKLGVQLLEKLANELSDFAIMENKPKRDGRFLSCILSPKPELVKKINERKRALEKDKRKKKEVSKKDFEEKQAEKAAAKANGDKPKEESVKTVSMFDTDEDPLSDLDDLLMNDDLTDDLFS